MTRSRILKRFAAGAVTIAVGAVLVSAIRPETAGAPVETMPANLDAAAVARATGSAASFVAAHPGVVRAGPDDAFVQGPAQFSMGWQYVPYERTYRGLPVIGGDFVMVIDPAGQVRSASVAQKQAITNVDTTPKVTQAAAEKVAAGLLKSVTKVDSSRLVVYALSATPRLAWESTVDGFGAGGVSRPTVYVDAVTAAVLDRRENLLNGTGTSAFNGPNPVAIRTTPRVLPRGFIMSDPKVRGLSCGDFDTNITFTSTADVWGNGNPADRQTACVDAMFAAQTEVKMASQWLGRNGLDGKGGAWPILVGLHDTSAFFDGAKVNLGSDFDGKWLSSLDVVAHELGHAIDTTTPGGLSQGGTKEFIADVFGTATEWFANEPAPFDTPDYVWGDRVNIARRHMFDPGPFEFEGPRCFNSSVPGNEPHVSASVGDHWFYLLAEGSHPSDGQPDSPTCDNTTVTGVGIQRAMQVLYNAMLMKTSASSYLAYRTWTLTAAMNLFPNDCVTYNTVKAAWNAVSVPAQPGENLDVCKGFQTDYRAPDGLLWETAADDTTRMAANGLGIAPGTHPAIAALSTGGRVVAFQANGLGTLFIVDSSNVARDTGLKMAPGTSPAIAADNNGGWLLTFQADTTRQWTIDSAGHQILTPSAMAPGTSPAIAALSTGGFQMTFVASDSTLWVVNPDGNGHSTGGYVAANTSPAITALPGGGYEITFTAYDNYLWEVGQDGNGRRAANGLMVAPGTSPAITALSTGGFEIVFQAYGEGTLWTVTPDNIGHDTGAFMAPGTSPAITSLTNGGFEAAIHAAATHHLWTVGADGNGHDTHTIMATDASPTITGARVGAIAGYGGTCVDIAGANPANNTPVQLNTCTATASQTWNLASNATIRALGKCLDVQGGSTTDGTRVQIFDCNGTGAQVWQPTVANELRNPQSGKCLDAAITPISVIPGTPLQISTCNGGATQKWTWRAMLGW